MGEEGREGNKLRKDQPLRLGESDETRHDALCKEGNARWEEKSFDWFRPAASVHWGGEKGGGAKEKPRQGHLSIIKCRRRDHGIQIRGKQKQRGASKSQGGKVGS